MSEQDAAVLWRPSEERVAASRLTRFAEQVRERCGAPTGSYEELWRWSVEHLEEFWGAAWEHFDVLASAPYERVLGQRRMPGARWFPGARLNLAENVLRPGRTGTALVATDETGAVREVSWDELRGLVGAFGRTLRELGVRPGDRVVAYLPNGVEAVVAMLGCASVGAVWSTCAPDIGPASAVDRFGQLDPVVVLAADGYRFGGKERDRREAVATLLDGLPTARALVVVPVLGTGAAARGAAGAHLGRGGHGPPGARARPARRRGAAVGRLLLRDHRAAQGAGARPRGGAAHGPGAAGAAVRPRRGRPGLLVHEHLLDHVEQPGRRAVGRRHGGALRRQPAVAVARPAVELAEQHRLTSLGTSPGYLLACEKAGLHPGREHDLSALRAVGVTGSPLPGSSYRWLYEQVSDDLALHVISGGTDFAAALVCDAPWLPVTEGEMSCRGLGIAAASWDEQGHDLVGEVGELVVTEPMPSMPLGIWGDDDGSRYRDAYFDVYPGVWRHGDWVTLTGRGTAVVHGRSDSTLNRHGVRMGSADLYAAVEALPEVAESLVLGVEEPDGGYWLPLFLRLADGVELDDALVERVRAAVREHASPRHVPDEVVAVRAVPHTATGKKLEVPLKRIAQGVPVDRALNLGAVDDPEAVAEFAALLTRRVQERRSTRTE